MRLRLSDKTCRHLRPRLQQGTEAGGLLDPRPGQASPGVRRPRGLTVVTETDRLNAEIAALERKLGRLYEDKLDEWIDAEFWQEKHRELTERKSTLRRRLSALDRTVDRFYESGRKILELAQNAQSLYVALTDEEKAESLKNVLSNSTLKGQTLAVSFLQPCAMIADAVAAESRQAKKKRPAKAADSVWRPLRGSNPCCRRERAVS